MNNTHSLFPFISFCGVGLVPFVLSFNEVQGSNYTRQPNTCALSSKASLLAHLGKSWEVEEIVCRVAGVGENTQCQIGQVNHAVTLTGDVNKEKESGSTLLGFYDTDTGHARISEKIRFISMEMFRRAASVLCLRLLDTVKLLDMRDEDIKETANAGNNQIFGDLGCNILCAPGSSKKVANDVVWEPVA